MAIVTLTINGRSYEMTCDDGQENHLTKLAAHIDERVQELAGAVGQVGEARLLVMASLLLADELYEAYKEVHALKAGMAGDEEEDLGSATVLAFDACAERIEAIAARLEGSAGP